MRFWRVAYHVAILNFASTQAATTTDPKVCAKSCRLPFRTLRFKDSPKDVFFQEQECRSLLYQQSVYICWDIHCTEDVWLAESKEMNKTCQDVYHSYFPPHNVTDGITDEEISQIPRFNETSPDRAVYYDHLMLPVEPLFDLWARTLDAYAYVRHYHYYYGWAMVVFWVLVVVIGLTHKLLAHWDSYSKRTLNAQGRGRLWFKRNVVTPATFGQRCVQDFAGWGTVPPRVQTLTLVLFLLLNIACSVHGYRAFDGYAYAPIKGMQMLRHVSDRTGVLSFANFPIIWLFGMRNNIVIWLTGWDFKTYNNFHRWVGRIAMVEAVIHSIGYSVLLVWKSGWPYFWWMWTWTYWWTGELATVFLCMLVGLSVFWFRRQQYELFLVLHIVLSILVLLGMLGHVSIFRGSYDPLVWIPAIIWALDRLARGARIFAFSPQFWKAKATVTYNEDAHMIRVVVPFSSSLYDVQPGTFYYLMVLNKWNFWESHPFTVASVSGSDCYGPEAEQSSPLLRPVPMTETTGYSENSQREMTFLIRPYESFTARLKEYAEAEQPKPATLRVAIDGPYGKVLPLVNFDKVVFIVGGSGIVVPVSYLKMLTSSTRPESIEIHWAIRQPALAIDVLDRELRDALGNERVKIAIYLTGVERRRTADEAVYKGVEWRSGRVNVEETVDRALDAGDDGSRLAVVTSGPGRMADETRRIVAARMVPSLPRVEYFEESFEW